MTENYVTSGQESSGEWIVQAHNLGKSFGESAAVIGINLNIEEGEIFGFIGPSGCGKTTTIRMLVGNYKPTEGEVTVWGKNPHKFSPSDRERIGYMPQLFVLYPQLTVWENLQFAASLYGVPLQRKARMKELLELVELTGHEGKAVKNISGGMQRRLSLAATLMHEPKLLFLDEPTAGIDPVLRQKIWEYFHQLKEQGVTLFITTQYVGEAANCNHVGLMSDGRLLVVETPDGLRRHALGGELIHIRAAEPIPYNIIQQLEGEEALLKESARLIDRNSLELLVEEADTALPLIMNWFDERHVHLEAANEYQPPYEDIFVKVIEAERAQKVAS